jgi:hypothetical protein
MPRSRKHSDTARSSTPSGSQPTSCIPASACATLKHGPNYGTPGTDGIIWEHGRRNLGLRAAGALAISCPIRDGSDIAGVGIFDREPEDVVAIMNGDPAIQAGVLTFEARPARSFPCDGLS